MGLNPFSSSGVATEVVFRDNVKQKQLTNETFPPVGLHEMTYLISSGWLIIAVSEYWWSFHFLLFLCVLLHYLTL